MLKFHDHLLSSLSSAACTRVMHCVVKKKKIKKSKILEIEIFEFIFGISFKKQTIQAQTRPCLEKDFWNPPICLISILAFRIEFARSPRIGCFLPKIAEKSAFLTSCVHMGCLKIPILIENEINSHQIYVPAFYLIQINILIAFLGKKCWNFMIISSPLSPPRHARV